MWKLRISPRHDRFYICLVQTKEMQGMEIITCLLVMVAVLRTLLTAKRRYSNTAVEFPPLGYYIVSVYRLCCILPLAGTRAHTCAGACMRAEIPSPLVTEGSARAWALVGDGGSRLSGLRPRQGHTPVPSRSPRPAQSSGLPSPLVHHRKGKPLKD